MANYPSIPFHLQSDPSTKDGRVIDRAMDGTGRGRNLYTAKKTLLTLKHVGISTANKDTLETFYDAHPADAVNVTWVDGTTRSMLMSGIRIIPWPNLPTGRRWDVMITAEQV